MSVGAITAGEAYVSITCDNSELVAGLRESSATIQATARSVAAAEDKLTVNVGVEGVGALESALTKVESAIGRVQKEIKESSATLAIFSSGVLGGLKDAVSAVCPPSERSETPLIRWSFGPGFRLKRSPSTRTRLRCAARRSRTSKAR